MQFLFSFVPQSCWCIIQIIQVSNLHLM
jgi:hypothetical protein